MPLPLLKFTKRWKKPSADRKPGWVAERGAADGERLRLGGRQCAPQTLLRPHGAPSEAPSSETDLAGTAGGGARLVQLPSVPPPARLLRSAPLTRTANTRFPGSAAPTPLGRPQRASPKPEQVQPCRAPSRVCTNLFARIRGNPARGTQEGSRPGHPGDRTHPVIAASWAPTPAATRPPPGAPSLQPCSARSPGATSARREPTDS